MLIMVLILSRKDLEAVMTMKETIEAVESAFKELTMGTARMPTRVGSVSYTHLTLPTKRIV